jgi:ABC-2 type transport system permease protein/lipopolysaccharide transport system permease protein
MDVRTTPSVPHAEFFPPPRSPRGPSLWLSRIDDDRRNLLRFWPVIQNMVVQELRVRYQRSVLGFFWTLVHPILMMTTLTIVFSQLFKTSMQNYAIFLFSGMVPWNFLSGSLNECAFSIISNEGLIRKIFLPKLVFPLTRVLINLTTFVLSLVALFILLKPMGARFTPQLLLLPLVIVLFTAFTFGLGLIVATTNTFFRDCGHLVTVFLQAWYFATPIIYNSSTIPPWRCWSNPAFPFIRLFQLILFEGQWPDLTLYLAAAGIATASLGIGYVAFKCHEDKFVFRL